MNILEWRHYRLILAIQNTGSLTGAARSVGVTQSAATHQVKEAERRLGVDLVKRRGRSLELTPAGATIAEAAERFLPEMQRAEDKARELTHSGKSRLRMAYGPQDGLAWLVDVAAYLSTQQIQLDLISAGRRAPAQCVQAGEADLALEIGDTQFPGVRRIQICEDELVCIMAPGHELTKAGAITVADIANETYFAHSLVPQPGFESETFFRQSPDRPAHIAHIESLEAIIALVAAGQGLSIQPRQAISGALEKKVIRIKPLAPKPIGHAWHIHASADVSPSLGEAFLDDLTEVMTGCFVPTLR